MIAPGLATLKRRCVGRRIVAVERAGKRVVVRLDSLDRLIFEPRMTGLVLLADPPTAAHLRLRIRLDRSPTDLPRRTREGASARRHVMANAAESVDASRDENSSTDAQLLFWDRRGLGCVRLMAPEEFERLLGPEKLGPDALALSSELLAERLASSRRAIKVALLDQKAIAGVGNLYASEILHVAGVHPLARCDKLSPDDWRRLGKAMRAVLRAAIRYEGSTLGDGTYRNALNERGRYQNHHRVYGRGKQACRTCGREPVTRIVQAQRATFYCAACQPAHADQIAGNN